MKKTLTKLVISTSLCIGLIATNQSFAESPTALPENSTSVTPTFEGVTVNGTSTLTGIVTTGTDIIVNGLGQFITGIAVSGPGSFTGDLTTMSTLRANGTNEYTAIEGGQIIQSNSTANTELNPGGISLSNAFGDLGSIGAGGVTFNSGTFQGLSASLFSLPSWSASSPNRGIRTTSNTGTLGLQTDGGTVQVGQNSANADLRVVGDVISTEAQLFGRYVRMEPGLLTINDGLGTGETTISPFEVSSPYLTASSAIRGGRFGTVVRTSNYTNLANGSSTSMTTSCPSGTQRVGCSQYLYRANIFGGVYPDNSNGCYSWHQNNSGSSSYVYNYALCLDPDL